MSEAMRESLSALLDDEANELEMQRVLARIADDPELRQVWVRYNMVRTLTGGCRRSLAISSRNRKAF